MEVQSTEADPQTARDILASAPLRTTFPAPTPETNTGTTTLPTTVGHKPEDPIVIDGNNDKETPDARVSVRPENAPESPHVKSEEPERTPTRLHFLDDAETFANTESLEQNFNDEKVCLKFASLESAIQ